MHNKFDKVSYTAASMMEVVIIFTAVTSIMKSDLKNSGLSLLAFVCITIPFIISHAAKKKKIVLPKSFNLVSILFIFAALYLGEINNFYIKYKWWDLFLHAVFGFFGVIVFLHAIRGVMRREIEVSKKRYAMFSVIIAFCFTITAGTLWEIFEFSGDYIFNSGMIKGGLQDTATDLLTKIAAALIPSVYYYLKNKET